MGKTTKQLLNSKVLALAAFYSQHVKRKCISQWAHYIETTTIQRWFNVFVDTTSIQCWFNVESTLFQHLNVPAEIKLRFYLKWAHSDPFDSIYSKLWCTKGFKSSSIAALITNAAVYQCSDKFYQCSFIFISAMIKFTSAALYISLHW